MNRASLTLSLVVAALLGAPSANATVVYDFVETAATIDGVPVDAPATGRIVLADGVASASGRGGWDDPTSPFAYVLDGVVSAAFAIPNFGGGFDTELAPGVTGSGLHLTATVDGLYLVPSFALSLMVGSEIYETVARAGDLFTVRYETDDAGSACFAGDCRVTGYLIDPPSGTVPEPPSWWLLATALAAGVLVGHVRLL